MSHPIDDDGNVYEPGPLGSGWRRQEGFLGPKKDVDWLGRPNIQHNLFGQREQARGFLGMPQYSDDGRPLYKSTSSTGYSAGGGDAIAEGIGLLLGIGLVVLSVLVIGAVFALLIKLMSALIDGWRELNNRYPRALLATKLVILMIIVGGGLYVAGFNLNIQLSGMLLVLGIWGWLWLTRHLPFVFMPMNALILGGGLFILSWFTVATWSPVWSDLVSGLPVLGNLPVLLATIPMVIWLWTLGAKKWPTIFRPLSRLVAGALLWFLLMRVWTDWQPYWESFMAPVPFMPSLTPWIILLAPLILWLWKKGQVRYPLPFTAINLLLFGCLLSLTAYHTEDEWISVWNHWMAGIPFLAVPILTISLSPVCLWGWSKASYHWRRYFVIPNLLLTGAILWWILDRTRLYWIKPWDILWGQVPLFFDPALLFLVLPLAVWLWRKGSQRFPQYWGVARALLLGGILWWVVERTRTLWAYEWQSLLGDINVDLVLLVAVAPLTVWIFLRLHRMWPNAIGIPALIASTLVFVWLIVRIAPEATWVTLAALALLPLVISGWLWLLRHRTLIAVLLILLLCLGIAAIVWSSPHHVLEILESLFPWLLPEGLMPQLE
ncbi:MAG: hypothetical protein GTO18_00145 [Anaerolineales bacterium]|nr:hypothetical protein [Anaerolineales bacterium]